MTNQNIIDMLETAREEYKANRDPKADATWIHNILFAEQLLRQSGASHLSNVEVRHLQMQSDREYHNGGDDPFLDALWMQNTLLAEMVLRS